MTPDELRGVVVAEARSLGLGHLEQALRAAARDAVRLTPSVWPEGAFETGACKFGGLPDLPPGVSWPRREGEPLAFVAQLDLAALSRFPAAAGLPREGLLSLFYDAGQRAWGFDPKDAGSFRLLFHPPGRLERRVAPADLDPAGRFTACALNLRPDLTLPGSEAPEHAALFGDAADSPEVEELYERLIERLGWGERSLLGGHPDAIQGDMREECALVTGGLYCGDASGWKDPRAPALRAQAPGWRLLLQISSEAAAGMMWGDAGCLYVWLPEDAWAAGDFARGWLVLQCS